LCFLRSNFKKKSKQTCLIEPTLGARGFSTLAMQKNIVTDGRAGKTSGTKHAISDHADPIKTLEWPFSVRISDVTFDWWNTVEMAKTYLTSIPIGQ
jgi:hypothetical protein